jgi:hypothetical protein
MEVDQRLERSDNQVAAPLGEELAILNVKLGKYYGLDRVGRRVWDLFEVPRTLREIKEALIAQYEVEPETLEADLSGLLDDLVNEGLLVRKKGG